MNALKRLNSNASARVLVNGTLLEKLWITTGTRQGYPLSQIFLDFNIEPLAHKVREWAKIVPSEAKGCTKISLYADNLILFTKCPDKMVLNFEQLASEFGTQSGYK